MNIAAAFPSIRFIGIDWSEDMLALAEKRCLAQPGLRDRMSFRQGDMRRLSDAIQAEKFEVFLTSRSLINLMFSDEQYGTIAQIAEHLKPGGYYFGIENFMQGQNNFNQLRVAMGLPEIPVRWHNHFFDEQEYVARTAKHFEFAGVRELPELLLSGNAGDLLGRLSPDGRGARLFPPDPPDCGAAPSDRRLLPDQTGEHAAEVLTTREAGAAGLSPELEFRNLAERHPRTGGAFMQDSLFGGGDLTKKDVIVRKTKPASKHSQPNRFARKVCFSSTSI